jgi:hypothetical protein
MTDKLIGVKTRRSILLNHGFECQVHSVKLHVVHARERFFIHDSFVLVT